MNSFDKFDDIIDSRDVIARIEELREERQDILGRLEEARDNWAEYDADTDEGAASAELQQWVCDAERDLENWDASDEADELRILEALASEGEASPDWQYGETLIRESYFKDYAQQMAEDCGMIPDNLTWPCTCIDWEQATRELRSDYSEIEFDDVTYLIRS